MLSSIAASYSFNSAWRTLKTRLNGARCCRGHVMAASWLLIVCPDISMAGQFANVTAIGVPGRVLQNGVAAWADYNNDGWVDLNVHGDMLRNNKNGTFSYAGSTGSATILGDYNNDGFVDMFQYAQGVLWRNVNGNSFAQVGTLPRHADSGDRSKLG